MARRHAVKDLSDEEFEFVIRRILENDTDRELSAAFYSKFKRKLAKSSLNRWRQASGAELAERYRIARFQARLLLEDLKEDPEADKYQVLMGTIEDRLLAATREVITKDPIKILRIRQEEEKRRLKSRELDIKEKHLDFQQAKADREANLQNDRFKIAADTWRFILSWFVEHDPAKADALTGNSDQLLQDLEAHLNSQTA